ncbi:MAG: DUF86 domain-containing protein [Clostridia bacterium]|nr:DUF86 domain-containing protein [Clostridia bacterium]
MDNIKNDSYYCRKLTADLRFIMEHTVGVTQEQFESDEVLQDCVMFRLIQISENSQRLTEDFKRRYNEIPWTAIKGLRNRIVHEYGAVDLTIIYDTVKNSVPELYTLILPLI